MDRGECWTAWSFAGAFEMLRFSSLKIDERHLFSSHPRLLSRCLMMPIELGRNAEGRTRQVTHVYSKEDKSLDDPYLEHIVSSAESCNTQFGVDTYIDWSGEQKEKRRANRNRCLNFWNNLVEKTTCQWLILGVVVVVGLVFVVVVSERLGREREKSSALMSIRWDRQCAQ